MSELHDAVVRTAASINAIDTAAAELINGIQVLTGGGVSDSDLAQLRATLAEAKSQASITASLSLAAEDKVASEAEQATLDAAGQTTTGAFAEDGSSTGAEPAEQPQEETSTEAPTGVADPSEAAADAPEAVTNAEGTEPTV